MFTGITEELGRIRQITSSRITVECKTVLENTKIGDSIAVSGICLTVSSLEKDCFSADISPETLKLTSLEALNPGDFVNLERAMPADGRFGGHIVSGHIDGRGKFVSLNKNGSFYELTVRLEPEQAKYVVKKGSVAINGISLTVAEINDCEIKIAVIPHTYENTVLKYLKTGDFVNIETDILSKYIEKFLSTSDNKSVIDFEFLQKNGF